MNYLTVEHLTKSFGEKLLFEDITFGLEKGQKTALIAKNGTGKSSLLNIIVGLDQPDSGQVVVRNGITISYLPQIEKFDNYFSVMDVVFEAQTPVVQAVKEYSTCLSLMKNGENAELLNRMDKAVLEMERLHAWDLESKVKEILFRFGIEDIFQNINELSGGQLKKAMLAKTLIADTDLLILDEPTNHLDIEMIEWLENYLLQANTTLLMVTHDRFFLDKICSDIIEIDNHKVYRYKGKYDYFLEKKAERIAVESTELEKIKQLYRKELEWVHISPQARTTKAKARINAFDQLKESASRKVEQKTEGFHVRTERLGNKILEINNLDFSYGEKNILSDFSYIFKKGEKCGIVGKNGTGKTTLLRLIEGELRPDAGKITPGQTIQFGYFSQEGLQVKGNLRIIDLVKQYAEVIRLESGNYVSASQFLNYFGFQYEQQYTYYDELSGGEKRKLHLLITLLKNPNFLILDEPTNDFDIDTLNLMEDFLDHYQGCLLVVSHDRWFMNKLVEHIFVFEGEGHVKDYYGNYTDYRIEKEKQLQIRKKLEKQQRTPAVDTVAKVKSVSNKLSFKEKREFEQLESDIDNLEVEKKNLLEKMNSGTASSQALMELGTRYKEVENLLDVKSMRWLELSEKEQ